VPRLVDYMSLRDTKPGHCEELDTVLNSDG